ncbi:MAG: mandelate racemase/muconate lactonizing enzyme family protein, partial [Oceanospirillaceae bacterium]|nr:mandelate racemase/muconate lactonizing enzyme family protein [Oceanospirillaceae bacterium]
IAPAILGLDPRRVDRVYDAMDAALVGHSHAKAALDVACWDLFGKAVSMPVCDLLGGRTSEPMGVISSIYAGSPEAMRERVQAHRLQGYRGHSIKIGEDPQLDADRVTACLADRQPGEYFIVDANGGLTVETGLRFLRLLPRHADIVLEAPCATWREHMSLRKRTDMPMIWDELANSDAAVTQLISDDAAEGVGLKISKNGGLTPCRRQRDMCISAGYSLSVQDTVGSDIAFAAIAHMGQTIPPHLLRCILDTRDMVSVSTASAAQKGAFERREGWVTAPQSPGLGIEPNMQVLGEPVMTFTHLAA